MEKIYTIPVNESFEFCMAAAESDAKANAALLEAEEKFGALADMEALTAPEYVMPAVVGVFLSTNIPTALFMIEYAILRSGKKKSELEAAEMAKTQIHDL